MLWPKSISSLLESQQFGQVMSSFVRTFIGRCFEFHAITFLYKLQKSHLNIDITLDTLTYTLKIIDLGHILVQAVSLHSN